MHRYRATERTIFTPQKLWPYLCYGVGILLLCLLTQADSCHAGEGKKIALLLSGESPVYEKVASNTIKRIDRRCSAAGISCPDITFERIYVSGDKATIPEDAFLTITFGTRAAKAADMAAFGKHLILSMLPRQSSVAEKIRTSHVGVTAIYIDQPYGRYFDLIKATLPRVERVGLLLHEFEPEEESLLRRAADKAGLILQIGYVADTNSLGESLSHLLADIDVFLAIPDSRIHNNRTISNILTTAYRNHIPVIGFSSAYVKAGATEAIYTSLDDISHQVSDVTIKLLTGAAATPEIQQAKYFSVSINTEVARSLGLSIRSPSEVESIILRGLKQ